MKIDGSVGETLCCEPNHHLTQMAGPDWEAIEEGDYGSVPWWDSVPGVEDLPEFEIPDDEGFLESLFSGVGGFLACSRSVKTARTARW